MHNPPNPEFKRWLANYLISRGHWKLTEKGVHKHAEDLPLMFSEKNGDISQADPEFNTYISYSYEQKAMAAATKIRALISEGKGVELYNEESISISLEKKWVQKQDRIAVVRGLVRTLGKDPKSINSEDFRDNCLGGLLKNRYKNSPYRALQEAGLASNILPWEMKGTPKKFYDSEENRIKAIRWLLRKLAKEGKTRITKQDIDGNGLGGLLARHYDDSIFKALQAAGALNSGFNFRTIYKKDIPKPGDMLPQNPIQDIREIELRLMPRGKVILVKPALRNSHSVNMALAGKLR